MNENEQIKTIMSVLRKPTTINALARLTNNTEIGARRLIARIRKSHPIYAFRDGTGYKYASKEEIKKLIKFEENLIRNHQANLKVLKSHC